jgi:glycosyltransferase involved in cell wall biosynthesis
MKILFVVPRYHPNHDGMVAGLLDAGHEVTFLVHRVGSGEKHREGASVIRLPGARRFRFILGLLRQEPPDVVVARNIGEFSYRVFLACRFLGIPYLLYVQYPTGYENMRLGRRLRLQLGLWPRHTINSAVPVPAREVPGKTYDFMPFAIDLGPAKTAYPSAPPIKILTVGKLDQKRKNLVPLVRHLAPLLRDGQINLTMVGFLGREPAPAYRALLDEIATQRVSGRVQMQENLPFEAMPQLYPAFDLFVLASSSERAAISPVEAMSAGLPAICGSDNGTNYFILPGETGFVFPDRDFNAMAGIIERLAADPGELARMGKAARRHVAEYYSPAGYARRFEDLVARRFGLASASGTSSAGQLPLDPPAT